MLITFSTRARYPDITMLGDAALHLIGLMGKRRIVPGTVACEELSDVLDRLRQRLQEEVDNASDSTVEDDDGEEETVPISVRAVPIIEMLEAAQQESVPIVWREGQST